MSRYIKDSNGNWQLSAGIPQIDDELDSTSENPVQNKAIVEGVSPMLNILGAKNLLPNNATTQTINEVTFTVNSDGTITVNGTATGGNANFIFYSGKASDLYYLNGMVLSGIADGIPTEGICLLALQLGESPWTGYSGIAITGAEATIENIPNDSSPIYCVLSILDGQTISNKTFYPMIRPSSIKDDTYAPYSRTNQELTGEVEPMLNVLGAKNLLPNATTQVINGVTFTIDSKGCVTCTGTPQGSSSSVLNIYVNDGTKSFVGKEVILTGCPSGGSLDTYYLHASRVGSIDGSSGSYNDLGEGVKFLFANNASGTYKGTISIVIANGHTVSGLKFKPMLRPASIKDDTYVPYAMTNRELTNNTRTYEDRTVASVFGINFKVWRKGNVYEIELSGVLTQSLTAGVPYTCFPRSTIEDSAMKNQDYITLVEFNHNAIVKFYFDSDYCYINSSSNMGNGEAFMARTTLVFH